MAKIDITRTELVWPGKYNDDGTRKEVPRVSLPFQVIETINQSRATREADKQRQQTLFDIWEGKEGDTFDAGWTNKLIWGDNLLVMGSLLEKFAGKIDLIYIDYWAVDWHFQNDTFMQGWVTYRTRKDRKLALTADPHTYDQAGCYRLLVKVVDIFGNDTS